MLDALLSQFERDLRAALGTCVARLVAMAGARFEGAYADVVMKRVEGLAKVAEERTTALTELAEERAVALAEVDARRAELG
jgi:methionyl-tRNA synthetase